MQEWSNQSNFAYMTNILPLLLKVGKWALGLYNSSIYGFGVLSAMTFIQRQREGMK